MPDFNREAAIEQLAVQLDTLLIGKNDYCIVERPDGPFVQYCTAQREPAYVTELMLDVPCKALTWVQADRAAAWFRERGVEGPSETSAEGGAPTRVHMLASWQLPLGRDTMAAATAGIDAATAIFGLDEVSQMGTTTFEA